MPDIELRLIADNEQYIGGIKESQTVYQQFLDKIKSGEINRQELIQGVVEGIQEESSMLKQVDQQTNKSSESLRSQLRKMREELAKMEMAGLRNTKAFKDLSLKAGELASQSADTSQRIKVLASNTKNLDAAMSISTGLAGGFAVAQGTMALFGGESENLQRQLVKLQGGMNLLNGLQQVANTLNKDSAARVVVAAKAQQLYNLVVGKSTGALKGFRIALALTGIGLAVIAIGALVANWDKLTTAIENFLSPQDEAIKKLKEQKEITDSLAVSNDLLVQSKENENKKLQAIGGNEDLIYKNRVEAIMSTLKLMHEQIKVTESELEQQQHLLNIGGLSKKQREETVKKMDELTAKISDQRKAHSDLATELQVITIQEQKRIQNAKDKTRQEADEKEIERKKELVDLLKDLAQKEEDARLSLLTGKSRIDAEEKIQLEEVDLLEKHLEKIGGLNKKSLNELNNLRVVIAVKANEERKALDEEEKNQTQEKNDKLKELQRKIEEDQLELINAGEIEKLQLKKKFLTQDLTLEKAKGTAESELISKNIEQQIGIIQNQINKLSTAKGKEGFSIWRLLGFDQNSEEGKKGIEAAKQSTSIILEQVAQIMDAELQQAEQHTQLVEQRLKEAESQLEEEKRLQEDGLANNVDLKRQEIAQLKIERDKALEEEKKTKKAQLLLDSATQASSMITATAKIIESFSGMPIIGQILSIAAIALMWGTFAASKVKATQMINQSNQLETGGHGDDKGIIKGRRHSQGGEKFLDNLEVEQGEIWGVLNRQASIKYASLFPEMIDSMNNLQYPNMLFKAGNQIINIDTKKMTSKLDSIDSGIKILNQNISNQSDAFYVGKTRVIKLSKNHTRIIHAAN